MPTAIEMATKNASEALIIPESKSPDIVSLIALVIANPGTCLLYTSLPFGDGVIKCIHTPGHTKGGMCYLYKDALFTGDTLFKGSVGRSDFIGGNFNELITSIKTKLMILDDNIKVYPGHMESSSIGFERLNNPFLKDEFDIF